MESGGVIWIGTCSVGWDVERCVTWNEIESGLLHGAIRGCGGGVMQDVISDGM